MKIITNHQDWLRIVEHNGAKKVQVKVTWWRFSWWREVPLHHESKEFAFKVFSGMTQKKVKEDCLY